MKKVLNFILVYFIFLISGFIIGTIVYSLYLSVINYVTGMSITFFNKAEIVNAFFYVSSSFLLLICPLMAYYRIRHPSGIFQTIAYVLICLITWGICFPGMTLFKQKYYDANALEQNISSLSGGYFREADGKVYYFLEDLDSENEEGTTTVVIDTSTNGTINLEKIKDDENLPLYKGSKYYKDILIKDTFSEDKIPLLVSFRTLVDYGENAFNKGLVSYIEFAILGLALCAVYAATSFYTWKLLNVCSLLLSSGIILMLNSLYLNSYFDSFINSIQDKFLIQKLSVIFQNPFMDIVNAGYFLVMMIIGVVVFIVHKAKNRNVE